MEVYSHGSTYIMMAISDLNLILGKIEEVAKIFPPGILPKGRTMDSFIGHTVINLFNITLTEAELSALEKGLTFCQTPGPPVNLKWMDFKEFHRRICLKFHFYNDNRMFDHLTDNEIDLIRFMAENLDKEANPYHKIYIKNLKIKVLGNPTQSTSF